MSLERFEASAPGKVILFGEHAVVYGKPAIAVPVSEVQAQATVERQTEGHGLVINAPDLGQRFTLEDAPPGDPLLAAVEATLAHLCASPPDATITVESTIPIASGLGSGAAVTTALVRALAGFLDEELDATTVSALVFEVEKIHHGTPSGIDNTVVAYEQPVYFVKGEGVERLTVGAPITLIIGDTGMPSSTGEVVGDVRRARERERVRYDLLFEEIGEVSRAARQAIESGDVEALGPLMDRNQELLEEIDVSSEALERLIQEARSAGALGAKLCGAGRGGNMVALVEEDKAREVEVAVRSAGAVRTIVTTVSAG